MNGNAAPRPSTSDSCSGPSAPRIPADANHNVHFDLTPRAWLPVRASERTADKLTANVAYIAAEMPIEASCRSITSRCVRKVE
jgi:hypothetical protein